MMKTAQIEEEYRKLSSSKTNMNAYKDEISSMERKASDALISKAKAETALNEALLKIKSLEALRRADLDHVQTLEDQIHHIQLDGMLTGSQSFGPDRLFLNIARYTHCRGPSSRRSAARSRKNLIVGFDDAYMTASAGWKPKVILIGRL